MYDMTDWDDLFSQISLCASLVVLTAKPLRLDHAKLSQAEWDFLQQLFLRLGAQITTTDTGCVISPTHQPLVRTHMLTLPEKKSIPELVGGLLPLLLFSNTQLEFTFHGVTHSQTTQSIAWYHELVFRYVMQYVGTYSLAVPKASLTDDGEVVMKVQSKQALSQVIPSFDVQTQELLTHVAVELIDRSEEKLIAHERLLRLAYNRLKVPLRFSTRISTFASLTQVLFFGSEYGYDNDFAFLQGNSLCAEKFVEADLLAMVKGVTTLRDRTLLGTKETFILLPILALTGGSLPIEGTHPRYESFLTFLSDFLRVDFTTSPQLVQTEGYGPLHCPEVVELEDI
jgi:hypothetical protein